jgi:hypothetical protein
MFEKYGLIRDIFSSIIFPFVDDTETGRSWLYTDQKKLIKKILQSGRDVHTRQRPTDWTKTYVCI